MPINNSYIYASFAFIRIITSLKDRRKWIDLYHLLKLPWCHTCQSFKIFGEKRGIGEIEFLGNLEDTFATVAQLYFGLSDEGTVNPILSGDTSGLTNDCAEVTLSEAHAIGIVAYPVLFVTVLVDELNEAVEDGLLARAGGGQMISLLMEQTVVVVHQCCNEGRSGGAMVVLLVVGQCGATRRMAEEELMSLGLESVLKIFNVS